MQALRLDVEDCCRTHEKGDSVNRTCCLVFARLASTRVPNKLLQKVGGRTLLDRGATFLMRLRRECPNVTPIVCCPPRETETMTIGCRGLVETLPDTVEASSWPELIAPHVPMLRERFDWVWDANVFCHPFLRVETGQEIVARMGRVNEPFTVTTTKRGIVWSDDDGLVIGADQLANTKTNPVYHELAHIAYCWPITCLTWSETQLAYSVNCYPLNLHWSELIDIDTPEDLEHARAVAGYLDGVAI